MDLRDHHKTVFLEATQLSDEQLRGRIVRLNELPPEERERLRSGKVYQITPGTVDDHLTACLRKKMGGLVIKP